MSNLGFQTIYRLFNAEDDIVCERFFLPPKQELAELLADNTRIVTLESQTPVSDFDVIAFSVSFEWDYIERPHPAAPGRDSPLGLRADAAPSIDRHRRRRHVRQSRAARAVCRRHRRRRRRSAGAVAAPGVQRRHRSRRPARSDWRRNAASTSRRFTSPTTELTEHRPGTTFRPARRCRYRRRHSEQPRRWIHR